MNYADMSDSEINVEVAKLIFPASEMNIPYYHRPDVYIYHRNGTSENKDYCNSWADAGPIIEQHDISLLCSTMYNQKAWEAMTPNGEEHWWEEKKPLRAAMVVFLMMQEPE